MCHNARAQGQLSGGTVRGLVAGRKHAKLASNTAGGDRRRRPAGLENFHVFKKVEG